MKFFFTCLLVVFFPISHGEENHTFGIDFQKKPSEVFEQLPESLKQSFYTLFVQTVEEVATNPNSEVVEITIMGRKIRELLEDSLPSNHLKFHSKRSGFEDNISNTFLHKKIMSLNLYSARKPLTPEQRSKVNQLIKDHIKDINTKNKIGETPVQMANFFGHKDWVELLIQNGASVRGLKNEQGRTLLHDASSQGHDHLIEFLLQQGIKINEKDDGGNTAIHLASYYAHLSTVKKLIQNRANISVENNLGLQSIHFVGAIVFDEEEDKNERNKYRPIFKLLFKNSAIKISEAEFGRLARDTLTRITCGKVFTHSPPP